MFDTLTDRLGGIFDTLTGRGALSEKDVDAALREIRVALLEADVALPVVKSVTKQIRERAIGEDVIRAVAPGQQVVKIVHDALVDLLGGDGAPEGLYLEGEPPIAILMAGLQGSGKTTTAAKLAKRITEQHKKKVLLASLDTRRPAAMEQLQQLAIQIDVAFLPIVPGQKAVDIAKRAMSAGRLQGFDVVILDTAGRTSIDEEMMGEAKAIADIAHPHETLLVADALTGQDAVNTAAKFHERLPLTGLVLTRMDGDGRGGAALSMRHVTGLPIKFLGVSEKPDGLDAFDARRVAGRILGRGDIVSLVEKASQDIDQAQAERMARKMAKGKFDLDDLREQFSQLKKMGGLGSIMGMLPGMNKAAKAQAAASGMDDKMLTRQEAIILSMTKAERAKPEILKASRKKRIAAGSGVDVADVNKLIKMHRQMADMMKKASKGGRGGLAGMMGGMGGGMPKGMGGPMGGQQPSLGQIPKDFPGLGSPKPASPSGLPGLGGTPLGPDGLPIGLPKK
ncbi:signal recognition particle protein [Maricaulis salignorans]|uniref:Signal recognition particle protein n=1 Tax=Maricaulis salignorans TaxID=144026 RepID=A0A1G9LCJ2_9PROT|nr:signal recognition particle protein [Maricaulis salignorans]SDL59566.1 signal recognition particle subunit FFH/SRP54 (srp54) [Maricaulis salignorans]